MRSPHVLFFSLFVFILPSSAAEGLHRLRSGHDVETTMDRFEQSLRTQGFRVFIRIDYATKMKKVGLHVQPMQALVFGKPKLGARLIQCQPEIAIDLPMKVLIYQGEQGRVWLTYEDPHWLAKRHELGHCGAPLIQKMSAVLHQLARAATQP